VQPALWQRIGSPGWSASFENPCTDRTLTPVAVRACPTKAGGAKYKGEVELLEMTDGVPRVLGQNVENMDADRVRQHLPELGF
jgi:hypothetical protein